MFLCIRLQGPRQTPAGVDAALRDKGKNVSGAAPAPACGNPAPSRRKSSAAAQGPPSGTGRRPHPVMPQTGPAGPVLHKNAPPLPAALRAVPVRSLLPQDTPQRCIACKHGSDDRKRHIQHPQHPDEPESADVLFRVITVVVARQPGGIQKSFFFIEADIGADTRSVSKPV